jgi:outer membrane lipoprotein carrier protein
MIHKIQLRTLVGFAGIASLVFTFNVHAGAAVDRLQDFYRNFTSMSADFVQTLKDADGEVIQESSGKLILQRPGKFRWDYEQPYPQQIVTDGTRLWIYDQDLEQVTVKSAEETIGNAPSLVLSGERPLEDDFSINDLGERDGLLWSELIPRNKESDFSTVKIAFEAGNNALALMVLADNFGQTTTIKFSSVKANPDIDDKTFFLVVPQGVDIVGE